MTQTECESAIATLAIQRLGTMWTGTNPGIPKYCSVRETGSDARGYFGSSFSGGVGRSDLAPICKVINTPAAGGTCTDPDPNMAGDGDYICPRGFLTKVQQYQMARAAV
jgi:hypothetical protein